MWFETPDGQWINLALAIGITSHEEGNDTVFEAHFLHTEAAAETTMAFAAVRAKTAKFPSKVFLGRGANGDDARRLRNRLSTIVGLQKV